MFNKDVFPKSWLPNKVGFKFVAVKNDDSEQVCIVQKRLDGTHYVRGVKWESIKAWKHLTNS
jgi:hypothetical protein